MFVFSNVFSRYVTDDETRGRHFGTAQWVPTKNDGPRASFIRFFFFRACVLSLERHRQAENKSDNYLNSSVFLGGFLPAFFLNFQIIPENWLGDTSGAACTFFRRHEFRKLQSATSSPPPCVCKTARDR